LASDYGAVTRVSGEKTIVENNGDISRECLSGDGPQEIADRVYAVNPLLGLANDMIGSEQGDKKLIETQDNRAVLRRKGIGSSAFAAARKSRHEKKIGIAGHRRRWERCSERLDLHVNQTVDSES
jgi:hypothetical protein